MGIALGQGRRAAPSLCIAALAATSGMVRFILFMEA
jgi:hypothetical protein